MLLFFRDVYRVFRINPFFSHPVNQLQSKSKPQEREKKQKYNKSQLEASSELSESEQAESRNRKPSAVSKPYFYYLTLISNSESFYYYFKDGQRITLNLVLLHFETISDSEIGFRNQECNVSNVTR